MIPNDKDLMLKKKVKLYNNLAKIDECQGRLLTELEIYPTPHLTWDFEVLGNIQEGFPYGATVGKSGSLAPLVGQSFSIKHPVCTGLTSNHIGPLNTLQGQAKQAIYGTVDSSANSFSFYLPNTKFQTKRACQKIVVQSLKDSSNDEEVILGESSRYGIAPIDDVWEIRLEISKASCEWLNPASRNIGTLITTIGELRQTQSNINTPETFPNSQKITLNDALERIKNLCSLLSYINGGYIGPLYIEGYKSPHSESTSQQISCAAALAFRTTPLEKIGQSWLTDYSDLNALLGCFSTFENMMKNSLWEKTFEFTFIQYYQAIQPGPIGWPVQASAVGAALERLSHMILLAEETDAQKKSDYELLFKIRKDKKERKRYSEYWQCPKYKKKDDQYLSQAGIRLSCLLERIGLTDKNADIIQDFLNVRNDALHPKESGITIEQRSEVIRRAIQWIDEILLWRIGYNGKYLDRSQPGLDSISPRYNLELRNSNW